METNDKNSDLREFDLMATEKYRDLTVREVAAMLESGEIESKPFVD